MYFCWSFNVSGVLLSLFSTIMWIRKWVILNDWFLIMFDIRLEGSFVMWSLENRFLKILICLNCFRNESYAKQKFKQNVFDFKNLWTIYLLRNTCQSHNMSALMEASFPTQKTIKSCNQLGIEVFTLKLCWRFSIFLNLKMHRG